MIVDELVQRHAVLQAQRHGDGEEFAERIPAEMVLGVKLLYVLGCGATGARLEQAAASDQRDNREHLRARAELDDRRDKDETDCLLPSLLPKPLPPPLLPFLLLLPASREGGALGLRFSYVSRLSSRADSRPLARPTSTASAPRPCGGSWTGEGARKSPSVDHLRTRPLDPALMERLGDGPAWPCEGTSTGGGLAVLKVTL